MARTCSVSVVRCPMRSMSRARVAPQPSKCKPESSRKIQKRARSTPGEPSPPLTEVLPVVPKTGPRKSKSRGANCKCCASSVTGLGEVAKELRFLTFAPLLNDLVDLARDGAPLDALTSHGSGAHDPSSATQVVSLLTPVKRRRNDCYFVRRRQRTESFTIATKKIAYEELFTPAKFSGCSFVAPKIAPR